MESISKKIVDLEKKNIILKTDGLKLSYEAPKDKINKEILDFLKENKSEIIKLLLNDTTEKWNSMGIYESKSFPLTDTQAAYLMGREECFSYGNVGCHIYFEIEYSCLDFNQVQNVWNELLERHEMLRMEITADKKQIISEIVPKNIVTFWDTTNETEDQILSMVREKFGNKQYNIYKAPLFDVGVISREKKNDILFLSVEMMVADWTSIWLLVKEFEDIYFGKKTLPILNSSFRRYVDFLLAEKESVAFYRDLEFWKSKIERIPEAPCLPTVEQAYDSNRFKHFSHSLNRDSWEKVVAYSKKYGITPTVAVLQVYVQIIRMWSSNKDFSLNLTMMNRNNLHSDLENIVGDFTELCVLECFNLETDTFVESARILQKQLFDNLDHKAFSGIKVLRELNKEKGIDKALMPYVFTSAVGLVGKTLESNFVGRMNEFGVSQTPQVFIDCQVMDDLEGLRIFWDVREGIFPDGLVEDMFFLFGKQIDKMEKECFWTQEDIVELPEWQKQVRNSVNNTAVKRELYRIEEGIIYSCRNKGNWDKSNELLANAAESLENAGADFIGICSNTMHKCLPAIKKKVNLPIVHIVDATVEEMKREGMSEGLLLGTRFKMEESFNKERFYKNGVNIIIPSLEERQLVHDIIFAELCRGIITNNSKEQYKKIIYKYCKGKETGVILGCTEIGLLIQQNFMDVPIFDTTQIHAKKIAMYMIE